MRQLRCDRESVAQRRVGGLFDWGTGEEDAELVSELNLLKNEFSSFTLSRFPSYDPPSA